MSYRKINPPEYKIGDIITYDNGQNIDIVAGYHWFQGIYKYYLMSGVGISVDEAFIDQKIGEANFY